LIIDGLSSHVVCMRAVVIPQLAALFWRYVGICVQGKRNSSNSPSNGVGASRGCFNGQKPSMQHSIAVKEGFQPGVEWSDSLQEGACSPSTGLDDISVGHVILRRMATARGPYKVHGTRTVASSHVKSALLGKRPQSPESARRAAGLEAEL
jgi:hypothetical protein